MELLEIRGPQIKSTGSESWMKLWRALKSMVLQKYEEEKTKAKAVMVRVEAVSLTADMWTSLGNMEACVAVTCHYMEDPMKLDTVLLGVVPFP
ncbi:uncharacterized protein [Antennarius striatus]|uniref:uncharacterized protein isoform X3 n=1 Tax=Antennarius striatus TaxID=241820 RepID=UPI0035B46852